jgi:hypothetical protein
MKKILLLLIIIVTIPGLKAQQVYSDFEGLKVIHFGEITGTLDTIFTNPAISPGDTSVHCARYIRNVMMYDNFKIYTNSKMTDVSSYASNSASAPKIKMKLYSSAPVGTPIQLQLGTSANNSYPTGVHSEYFTVTTMQDAWQSLTFNYQHSPSGGLSSSVNLDKMVILFNPTSTVADTFYFDDMIGPSLVPLNVPAIEMSSFKLFQNSPNPAKEIAHINFQLSTSGHVSLKLFDMIGNQVLTMLDQEMKPGNYSIPVETDNIPDGIYFYTLKKDGVSRSLKMIISK